MKNSLKQVVTTILCASLLGGAVAMMSCTAPVTKNNYPTMDKPNYSFDLLASEKPEVNTSIPVGYMDLTKVYGFAGPPTWTMR